MVVKETPDNFDYRGTTSIYAQDDQSTPLLMLNHSSGEHFNFTLRSFIDFRDSPTWLFSLFIVLISFFFLAGDKDAMLGRFLVDFMMWAVDNPAPANIILVLGDNMSRRQELFKIALGQVNMLSYNIHFAYPQNATCPSFPSVHIKWLWESLSLGGNPVEEEKNEEEDEEED